MTQNEKEALIRYLDSQLLTYVESFSRHVDNDVHQQMYDDAYSLLADIDMTLDVELEIQSVSSKANKSS